MTRKQAPFVDIFLTNEMVSCTIFQHPDPINQQPFAMAYAMDNKWLYGQEAANYAKQYPQSAVLSLSKLLGDEKEIQIADKTFSTTALIVYDLQQIDRQVHRCLGTSAHAYTVTVSNSLDLFKH